ncbi:Fe2OG dioxygenase domain-containing protein [Balamuthia mandrillaris]
MKKKKKKKNKHKKRRPPGSRANTAKEQAQEFTIESYAKLGLGNGRGGCLCNLGASDSCLYFDVLPPALASSAAFGALLAGEVPWEELFNRGRAVPRLVCTQGARTAAVEPIYRHPTDRHSEVQPWTPTVAALRQAVERHLQEQEPARSHPLNHVLIQLYRDATDFISEHADKTLDVLRGSPILNLSLGASRVMELRPKQGNEEEEDKEEGEDGEGAQMLQRQRITLPHNSLFVLGWETNRKFRHSIPKEDEARVPTERREDENREEGRRISLTFRSIATFRRFKDGRLFGQGAKCKTEKELDDERGENAQETEEEEAAKLLSAFHRENSRSDFEWEKAYASGFDVIDFSIINNGSNEDAKPDTTVVTKES